MFIKNGKRFNIYAPATINGVEYHNFTDAHLRSILNITEIPEITAPADYTEQSYYRTEQDYAPYVIYTKKSAAQIKELQNNKLQTEIARIEESNMLPRHTREFMIQFYEQQGISLENNFVYNKVKDIDATVASLRTQIQE